MQPSNLMQNGAALLSCSLCCQHESVVPGRHERDWWTRLKEATHVRILFPWLAVTCRQPKTEMWVPQRKGPPTAKNLEDVWGPGLHSQKKLLQELLQ
jgi:hypothetical protein